MLDSRIFWARPEVNVAISNERSNLIEQQFACSLYPRMIEVINSNRNVSSSIFAWIIVDFDGGNDTAIILEKQQGRIDRTAGIEQISVLCGQWIVFSVSSVLLVEYGKTVTFAAQRIVDVFASTITVRTAKSIVVVHKRKPPIAGMRWDFENTSFRTKMIDRLVRPDLSAFAIPAFA